MVQNIDSADKAKPSTSSSTETKPMSFEDYRKRKENDRSSKFKPKTGGKRAKVEKEVKIQVGLVRDKNGDGFLVRVKSRTITLAVGEDCDAATLLEKAVNKHARHHKQFDKDCKYVLLYHDMTMVKNLPQSTAPFVLSKYQKDLLIPYSKMYFWLCTGADFENSISDDSSDTEIEEITGLANRPALSRSHSSITTSYDDVGRDVDQSKKLPPSRGNPSWPSLTESSSTPDGRGIESYLVPQHQCPTCLEYFSRADIEVHADTCAENWVDPIGKCVDMGINNDHQDLEETLTADEDGIPTDPIEARRYVIQKLKDNVNRPSTNRIAIRRREAFTDYSDARRKKWFTEGAMLKINFVGEPSVDGGGPRREFFTGKN